MTIWVPLASPQDDNDIPDVQVNNSRKRAMAKAESSGLSSQRRKMMTLTELTAFQPVLCTTLEDEDDAAASAEHSASVIGTTKNPDWLESEDLILLKAVQEVLEMPPGILMPAHTPNWDLVADIVNTLSSIYRSPKMCKQRFENEIAKKEEIRTAGSDVTSVEKKGTKTSTKLKLKNQKIVGVNATDNSQYCKLYGNRFDMVRHICGKRKAPVKSPRPRQVQRNPTHINILTEHRISFDKPFNPKQVTEERANRIQRINEAVKQLQQMIISQNMHNASSQISKPGTPSAPTGEQSQLHQSRIQMRQGQGTNVESASLLRRPANPNVPFMLLFLASLKHTLDYA